MLRQHKEAEESAALEAVVEAATVEALKMAKSYIGSLTGKEVPGIKGLAAIPVLFKIDAALDRLAKSRGKGS